MNGIDRDDTTSNTRCACTGKPISNRLSKSNFTIDSQKTGHENQDDSYLSTGRHVQFQDDREREQEGVEIRDDAENRLCVSDLPAAGAELVRQCSLGSRAFDDGANGRSSKGTVADEL